MDHDSVLIGLSILLAGIISIEIGFSTAMLEILAGVIASNILGISHPTWLDFLADFGLVGILFYAGFEVDPKLLKVNLKSNILIGILSYLVPFLLILAFFYIILKTPMITAIIAAISLATTSVALIYSVLREKGLMEKEHSQIILGSALILEVSSILSLPLMIGFFTLSSIIYIILALIFFALSPRLGRIVFKRYRGSPAELEIKLILLLLVTLPFIAERAFISEALLAFLMGVLFSEIIEDDAIVKEKLRGIIFGFLAPAFFFRAGLFIDLSLITPAIIALIIVLVLLVFSTKYISAFLISYFLVSKQVARMIGYFLNFNLTFGIIAAVFGLSAGILPLEYYVAILITILLTSLLSSIILRVTPEELYRQTFL